MAFVVALGAFMAQWNTDLFEKKADDLALISDTAKCNSIGFSIQNICQTSHSIKLDLKNRDDLRIDKFIVRVYDIYLENIGIQEMTIKLSPNKMESFEIIKQGTTKKVEITPVFFTDKNQILCNEKVALAEEVKFC